MSRIPTNLPQQLTSFVGRTVDSVAVCDKLKESRLVTLTGAGGLGKTRLAIEVALCLLDAFPGGVWFVDLATRSDADWPLQAVASTVGLPIHTHAHALPALSAHLHGKRVLLILDNCEHLIDSCARIADDLLPACPDLRILATSRQALGADGEAIYLVPPLSLPDPARPFSLDALGEYESVQLFLERAASKRPGLRLTEQIGPALAHLCRSLDGMPLAIELAAACVQVLSIEQIAARVDDRFRLLSRGSPAAPPRHQSLTALIDWSYNLLSNDEKRLLRALSVFAGGFVLEACRFISPDIDERDLTDLLRNLVDKSLLIHEEHDGIACYRMLETIRQYAHEKLSASGEHTEVRGHHLSYYSQLVETADREFSGPAQAAWISRLKVEYDNIRSAMLWAIVSPRHLPEALRMVWALRWFWVAYGALADAREIGSRAFMAPGAGHYGREMGRAMNSVGMLAWYQGDDAAAQSYYEQSLSISRSIGDLESAAFALKGLASLARRHGDHITARSLSEEALKLDEKLGDPAKVALSLLVMGRAALQEDTYHEAARLLQRSRSVFEALGDRFGIASTLYELAYLASQQHRYEKAAKLALQSLSTFEQLGVKFRMAQCLRLLAEMASIRSGVEPAATLYGAAHSLFNDVGSTLSRSEPPDYERHVALARSSTDKGLWDACWSRGAAMIAEQAIEYAFIVGSQAQADTNNPTVLEEQPLYTRLTTREREVLKLVVGGLNTPQIAGYLCISRRTVEAHMRSIFGKLHLIGRNALVQYVQENNLD